MFDSRSLRLVASISRHERLQSRSQLVGIRSFSINTHKFHVSRHLHHRPRPNALRVSCSQQTRSLSLFGWGSSKSSEPEFSQVHSGQPAGSQQQPVYEKWETGTGSSAPSPVKAVHATSDTPPNSSFPHTPEPEVLRDIENAIAAPHPAHGAEPLLPAGEDLSAIPERIGYLKEICGLDYGWGPTALLEFTVEHLHIYGGLTWAASIVGCAFVIRLLAIGPAAQSSNIAIRLKQANPALEPLRAEYKAAGLVKDTKKQTQIGGQMRLLMKEYNISYSKLLLPLLIQAPLTYGGFRLFRGMAALPVPAFEAEKWLWTSDLTQSDPLVILPLISAAALYASLRLGSETGTSPMQGSLGQTLKVFLPLTSMVFIYVQPGAVQLFFTTSSILALCQTVVLRNAFARRWLGLLPSLPDDKASVGGAAPAGLKTWQDPLQSSDSDPRATALENVSVVDRYVDAAKGRYTSLKESVLGKAEDRVAAREKEKFVTKAEKYEHTRRQQSEWDREQRNRTKNTVVTNKKGGNLFDELVGEDTDRPRTPTLGGRKKRSTKVRR